METLQQTTWILTIFLAGCRALGMVLLTPPMSHEVFGFRLRVALAVVLGVSATGVLSAPVALSGGALSLIPIIGRELLLGAMIGLAAALILLGVRVAALHISQQMGLGLADAFSPLSLGAGDPVRRLYRIVAVVMFVLIGGHQLFVAALMRTFRTIPLGGSLPGQSFYRPTVGLLAGSFLLALQIAAPVLAAMLAATVVLGLLQRMLPQCNLWSIGLPVRAILGVVILSGALAMLAPLMESAVRSTLGVLDAWTRGGGGL